MCRDPHLYRADLRKRRLVPPPIRKHLRLLTADPAVADSCCRIRARRPPERLRRKRAGDPGRAWFGPREVHPGRTPWTAPDGCLGPRSAGASAVRRNTRPWFLTRTSPDLWFMSPAAPPPKWRRGQLLMPPFRSPNRYGGIVRPATSAPRLRWPGSSVGARASRSCRCS